MSVCRTSSRFGIGLVGGLVVVSGCSKTLPPPASATSVVGASVQTSAGEQVSTPSVDLSPTQVQAIAIARVGTSPFVDARDAVGTIAFDEDLAIVQAEAALLGAAATFDLTTKELARAKGLTAANGGISQREVEQATSDQETAAGALAAARDAVRAFGKTDADIDRLIATHQVDPRADSASIPFTKWALATVTETDVPLFGVGQSVKVTVPAYPNRVFTGRVSRIYAVLDSATHRGKLRVRVEDPENALRPGMLANFAIQVRPPTEATAIPMTGVVREGDGSMTVWVTTDERHFSQRTVRVGLAQDGRYQVLDGLHVGELVVTDGAVFLSSMLQTTVPE